jgi:hypothetical protein
MGPQITSVIRYAFCQLFIDRILTIPLLIAQIIFLDFPSSDLVLLHYSGFKNTNVVKFVELLQRDEPERQMVGGDLILFKLALTNITLQIYYQVIN